LLIYEKLGSGSDWIKALNSKGFVYTILGMSEKAIAIYTQAKKKAEEIQDQVTMDVANQCLGVEYIFAKKYDDALSTFVKQLSSKNTINYSRYRAWVNACCGIAYYYKNDLNNANEHFKISYNTYEQIGLKTDAVWTLSWFILLEIKMGKLDQQEALKTIHEQIEQNVLKNIDYPEVHYNLFRIYNELQDFDKSVRHLDIAYKRLMEIAETIKNKEYKHSFLKGRMHCAIVEAWKENN
jgi:tetratricopeptide (TPR) repeat protein